MPDPTQGEIEADLFTEEEDDPDDYPFHDDDVTDW